MDVCAVVLAAGEGRRLRPLTETRPKALCPVGNVPLLDRALAAVAALGLTGPDRVAVNAWHLADQIVAHVGARAHVSVEHAPAPLGSAGGLAELRDWADGRHVLVGNADAYLAGGDIAPLLRHWDGEHVRLLGVPAGAAPAEFGGHRFAGFSLLPWRYVARLAHAPADLVKAVWRPAEAMGQLRVVEYAGHYLDSGTPADYVAANLDAARVAAGIPERRGRHAHSDESHASDSYASNSYALIAPDALVAGSVVDSVVGGRAEVFGHVERSVIWPDAYVGPEEKVVDAIRYGTVGTIDARRF